MGKHMPRRTWIGLAFLLAAGVIFGGWEWWMASRTWVPLDMPVSLAPGHIRSPEFRINLKEQFVIYVDVERSAQFDGGPCWLGFSVCPEQPSLVQANWTISDSGKIVAQGGTDRYRGRLFGTVETGFRPLGDFALPDGKHYVLDVDFLDDGSRLNVGHPRLKIGQPSEWMYEEDGPWFFLMALVVATIGAIPLISGIAEHILGQREDKRVSLTTPGPLQSGFVVGTASSGLDNLVAGTHLNLTPTIGQNFQWAQRMPLRRRFSGLPAFGVAGGTTFAILAILMMLLTADTTRVHSGLPVRLLKLGEVPAKSDTWTEPLIVSVEFVAWGQQPDLFVDSKQIAWEDLDATLKEELGRRKDWTVYVTGDDNSAFQNVADVIDVARKYHATVFLLTGKVRHQSSRRLPR